jgi:hypothetical protein
MFSICTIGLRTRNTLNLLVVAGSADKQPRSFHGETIGLSPAGTDVITGV